MIDKAEPANNEYDENSKHIIGLKEMFSEIYKLRADKVKQEQEQYVTALLNLVLYEAKGENYSTPFKFKLDDSRVGSFFIEIDNSEIPGAITYFNYHGINIQNYVPQKIAGITIDPGPSPNGIFIHIQLNTGTQI
jgi:hypothetical protein